MTNIFPPGIGTEATPKDLVAVVPGPAGDSNYYYNIVGTGQVAINAELMVVGGGFYVDLDNGDDTIRAKPSDGSPFLPVAPVELPNSIYMLGGEISMDRKDPANPNKAGNDLIKVIATEPLPEGYSYPAVGIYMGAFGGEFLPIISIPVVTGSPGDVVIPPISLLPLPPFLPLPELPAGIFPALGGNAILTGAGNDTISIQSGRASTGLAGDGLIMDGLFTGNGNLVQMGAGDDSVGISASGYGVGMFGSSNYIYLGDGNDTIRVNMTGVVYSRPIPLPEGSPSTAGTSECASAGIFLQGGNNGIIAQEGDDVIQVTGTADYGIYNQTGSFYTGQGNDKIDISNDKGYGIYQDDSGVLAMGAGDDTLISGAKDGALYLDDGSLLKTGAGKDYLSFTTNGPKNNTAVGVYDASQILLGKDDDTLKVEAQGKTKGELRGIDLDSAGKFDAGEGNDYVFVRQVGADEDSDAIKLDEGSAFYLGSGNDTVKVESDRDGIDIEDGSLFDLGDGNNLVDIINKDSKTDDGIEIDTAAFTAGSGSDTVKIVSRGGGFDAYESSIKFGAGNNLLWIDADAPGDDALELDYSTMSFGEADDGDGNDTIKINTTSGDGIDMYQSSLTMGGGNNLIDVTANEDGVQLDNGSNIVFGEDNDTLLIRSQASGFNGLRIENGSGVYMSNGANLVDVKSNGDDAIEIDYFSKLITGSANDTILAESTETSDRSNNDAGIELDYFSGLFTGEGDDYINAKGTFGIQVTFNSGIDTGFGLDTIIAKGKLQAGILLVDSSINTGNNHDYIEASSDTDYALRTGTADTLNKAYSELTTDEQNRWLLSLASINTGRGGDTVKLFGELGWSTNGGGSINTGSGNDLVILGGTREGDSYEVVDSIPCEHGAEILNKAGYDPASNGMNPENIGAAYINFGRGGEDALRLGVGTYALVYTPEFFEGLYFIIDKDLDILAVTNLEFIGGIGTNGDATNPLIAFPTTAAGGSFVDQFQIDSQGRITT